MYVVDADLKGYFDTIPKDRLLAVVQQQVSDSRLLKLIKQYLDQGILEELRTWTPETGVPQGAVLSPVLANAYLNPLDHQMANLGYEMVRYADDFVILCRTLEEAQAALAIVQAWVSEQGLTLHPDKTRIVDYREESFAFLGYSFRGRFRFPRAKSHEKFMDRIRELTPRKSGESLDFMVQQLNRSLRGWFHYFRHCFDSDLRHSLRLRCCRCVRLFLLLHSSQRANKFARHFVEGLHKLDDGCLHGSEQLAEQFFPAWHRRKCLDGRCIQRNVRHCAGLQHQLVIGLSKIIQHLGSSNRVRSNTVDQRSDQLIGQ